MKDLDKNECGGICYSLVGIFIFIIVLIIFNNRELVDMAERHSGLASWVQAVFSVLAILGAGYFPIIHSNISEKKEKRKLFRESLIVYVKHRDDLGKLNLEIGNLLRKPDFLKLPDESYEKDYFELLMRKIIAVEISAEELFMLDGTSAEATAKIVKYNAAIKRLRMLIERDHYVDGTYDMRSILESLNGFGKIYSELDKDLMSAIKEFDAYAIKNKVLIKMGS